FDLKGYSTSDYAGCNMDRKSTSAKAEYVAAAGCCANILWMKSQLTNYDIIYKKVPIFCDNTSAIAISNNPVLHSRTKHIDILYHFIRDHIPKGDIELHFIPTQYQVSDIFTKSLDEPTFKRLIVELGMLNIDPKLNKLAYVKIMGGFVTFARACMLIKSPISAQHNETPNLNLVQLLQHQSQGEVRGEIGIPTFRNAIKAHYSDEYVDFPFLAIVKPWFTEIGYNGEIKVKGN
ncbi:hypothetical protein Tco_1481882, partial [Tanacetum coccineum]